MPEDLSQKDAKLVGVHDSDTESELGRTLPVAEIPPDHSELRECMG
jgi:hypothetical protein